MSGGAEGRRVRQMALSFFRQKAALAAKLAQGAATPELRAHHASDELTWLDLAEWDEKQSVGKPPFDPKTK